VETTAEVFVVIIRQVGQASAVTKNGELANEPAQLDVRRQRVNPGDERQRFQQGQGFIEHSELVDDERIAPGVALQRDATRQDLVRQQFALAADTIVGSPQDVVQ